MDARSVTFVSGSTQVFISTLRHCQQTDIHVSDGPDFHHIQVKTVEASCDERVVLNGWQDSHVNLVIIFARNSAWAVVAPTFQKRCDIHKRGCTLTAEEVLRQATGRELDAEPFCRAIRECFRQ